MKMEINENPDELNSSQVGSNASSKEKKDYIEVIPSLPTYHIDGCQITKVLKLLFIPEKSLPVKEIIEHTFGFTRLIDYGPGDEGEFSTLYDHPDTVICYKIEKFLVHLNLDIDFAKKKLAEWGITKVLLYGHYDKPVGIDVFFDAFKKQYENNDEEIVIQNGDKEIRFRNPIWFKD